MKTNLHIPSISALCILAALALAATPGTASAQVYVTNEYNATVTEYTMSGAPVGSGTLINGSGLSDALAITVSGTNIFVLTSLLGDTSIIEYNTSGAREGTGAVVTNETTGLGLDDPFGMAMSGSDIIVTNYNNDTITEYTTAGEPAGSGSGAPVGSGTLVNDDAMYISGQQLLDDPTGIAVSGSYIFVVDEGRGDIVEYTTAGAPVGSSTLPAGSGTLVAGSGELGSYAIAVSGTAVFIADYSNNTILEYNSTTGVPVGSGTLINGMGLDDPHGMAVSGSYIFVTNVGNNTVTEYTTAGAPVGTGTLVSSGLSYPTGIYVVPCISDSISLGGGWNWSKTIGYFAGLPPGWIYHEQLGWLYFDTDDISSDLWIWDPASGMGWVWTNLSTYPNMYRASDGAWLWYDEGTTGPCWFYNLTAGKWESH